MTASTLERKMESARAEYIRRKLQAASDAGREVRELAIQKARWEGVKDAARVIETELNAAVESGKLVIPTPAPVLEVTAAAAAIPAQSAAAKNAARQAELRKRRERAGLRQVTLWMPGNVVADWTAAAAACLAAHAEGRTLVPVLKNSKTGKLVKGAK